jgi:hypothetical protein
MSARAGEGARREQRRSVRLDELMSKRLCDRLRSTPKTSHKDAQFADLEAAGGVKLSERQRSLQALADSWTEDLYIRRSARPKRFRECLDEMDDAFAGVEKACQWDDHPQYALVHWAMETSVKGAEGFPVRLSAFEVARGVKPGGTNAQSIANRDEALQRAGDATDTRRACRYVGQQGCRGAQPQRHCHTEGWVTPAPPDPRLPS